MSIRISISRFEEQTSNLIDIPGEFYPEHKGHQFEPWNDYSILDSFVGQLQGRLESKSELEYFRLGLAWFLNQDMTELGEWLGADADWTDEQIRGVLEYAYQKLYPDHPLPPPLPEDVEFVGMSRQEWEAYKKAHPLPLSTPTK